jgi:hypothetical protein
MEAVPQQLKTKQEGKEGWGLGGVGMCCRLGFRSYATKF